jgi:hypothetical protein
LTTTRTEPRPDAASRALVVAAVAPPVALALFTIGALLLSLGGRHPLWRTADVNLAEAAATRDAASVVFLIAEGHDPDVPRFVRPGVLARGAVRTTPLEAAIAEQRMEIVDILLRHGATLTESQRLAFTCAARRRGDADVVRYFEARGGPVTCPDELSRHD